MLEFYKIEREQYKKSVYEFAARQEMPESWVNYVYDDIKLPTRGTARSGAYDFYAPFNFEVGRTTDKGRFLVPTGIGFRSDNPAVQLLILPRSGLGRKGLHIANVVPLIDNDYCEATNGGHIMLDMYSAFGNLIEIEHGQAFAQGIFLQHTLTDDDSAANQRTGGFGSTDNTGPIKGTIGFGTTVTT